MHSKLMGSSTAERRMNCLGSYALELDKPDSSSSYADEGSMLHDVVEMCLNEDRNPYSFVGFTKYGHTLTKDLVDEMIRPALNAWNRLLDAYDIEDYEFVTEVRVHFTGTDAFGTIDVLACTDKYTINADWKFGRGVAVAAGPKNTQCLFGLAAAKEYPSTRRFFSDDRQMIAAIIQPAFGDGLSHGVVSHAEVEAFGFKVRETLDLIEGGSKDLVPGKWCKFCKAKPECPAKTSRAQQLAAQPKPDTSIDAEFLAEYLALSYEMQDWAKSVQDLAHVVLEKGEELPGYKMVKGRNTRNWESDDAALGLFKRKRIPKKDYMVAKMMSPAQAEKYFKREGIDLAAIEEIIVTHSSGTKIVPEDAKGEPVRPSRPVGGNLNLPAQ